MKTPPRTAIAAALLLAALPLRADEGKWMPQQIPALADKLRAIGFEGDPQAFADLTGQPMGAIVSLGGCTASFVSPEGLIATNHHCVTGALQYNSTPQRNLLVDGFLAKTRAEELWNGPGSKVWVTVSVKDVTEEITGKLDPKLDDRERYDAHRAADQGAHERRARRAGCAAAWRRSSRGSRTSRSPSSRSRTCASSTRPPRASATSAARPTTGAGRATPATGPSTAPTSARTASPRAHAASNVPYKPARCLQGAARGRQGGRPRVRDRLPRPHAAPRDLRGGEGSRGVDLPAHDPHLPGADRDPRGARQAGPRAEDQGRRAAIQRPQQHAHQPQGHARGPGARAASSRRRRRDEKELAAWIAADPARQKEYGDVLPALAALQAEAEKTRERDAVLAPALPVVLDAQRRARGARSSRSRRRRSSTWTASPSYQERNWTRIREGAGAGAAHARPAHRPGAPRLLRCGTRRRCRPTSGSPASTSSRASRRAWRRPTATRRSTPASRSSDRGHEDRPTRTSASGLLDKTTAEIAATKDPMVDLALALDPLVPGQPRGREAAGRLDAAPPALHAGAPRRRRAASSRPTRTRTLRVTFGTGEGQARRAGRDRLDARSRRSPGIEQKAHRRGRVRRARRASSTRSRPCAPASRARTCARRSATCRSTSSRRWTRPAATPARRRSTPRASSWASLFDGTYDTVASDFLFDTVSTRARSTPTCATCCGSMSEVDGAAHLVREMGVR